MLVSRTPRALVLRREINQSGVRNTGDGRARSPRVAPAFFSPASSIQPVRLIIWRRHAIPNKPDARRIEESCLAANTEIGSSASRQSITNTNWCDGQLKDSVDVAVVREPRALSGGCGASCGAINAAGVHASRDVQHHLTFVAPDVALRDAVCYTLILSAPKRWIVSPGQRGFSF